MPYLAKGPRTDINNGPGVTRIVPTFWPILFKFEWNNGPSPGHSNRGSDGRYTCSNLPLMVWWVPYLNTGCRPEFNNSLGGDLNSDPVWPLGVYLSPNRKSNNGSSLGHSNLVSDEVYICSDLLLMASWWLQYWSRGPTPDFNSGPGKDSNIGCILAFQHLFESNLNNSPSQAIPILCQIEYTSVQVFYLWFPGGCHICPRATGLISIMA